MALIMGCEGSVWVTVAVATEEVSETNVNKALVKGELRGIKVNMALVIGDAEEYEGKCGTDYEEEEEE